MTGLLDRHVGFAAALRQAGLPVSIAETLDAVEALRMIELVDRESLRAAYAATVVKRQLYRPVFDALFDLYFPATAGAGAVRRSDGMAEPAPERPAPAPWEVDDPVRLRLREELFAFLLDGDEQLAAGIARDAVSSFGVQSGTQRGRQSWSRMSVLDRLAPQTLMAGLLEQLLHGSQQHGLAEPVARAMIARRLSTFTALVDTDIRRRMAERDGTEAAAKTSRRSIDTVSLQSATKVELAEIRREIQPLARRLAARLAQQRRRGRRGQLDMRRTIRESLSTGGVLFDTQHKPRRPARTDLVVLCDVSQSVTSFAHFTLLLVYALREQFSRVRTFAFVDEIDEVTKYFLPGVDVLEAVQQMGEQANVTGLLGRTDYGAAIEKFGQRWPEAIGRRSSLLILGDARSNYASLALPQLEQMATRAHRAHWLNPERRSMWDTGDSVASRYDAIVPMVECRNLAQLGEFVRDLVD
ncbi:MAG: VWA domain-containing protein [Jatrophihabitantaceae bacterium]